VFGKSISDYLRFQQAILVTIAVVGQMVVQQAIAVIGIMTAIAGFPNVYAAPSIRGGRPTSGCTRSRT
jgi:hypothetical protein